MIPFSDKKYDVIYCDPPWRFKCWSGKGTARAAENHYPTMTLNEIKNLPVQTIALPDCALFIWATMPQLPEALEVIRAWGFKYKTCAFTWVKTRTSGKWHVGLGYWTRANAELCLLAVQGKIRRVRKDVRQLIVSPLREHSRKPDEARERIVALMGDLPRIELFSRIRVPGWDSWGLEADLKNFSKEKENSGECARNSRSIP